METDEMEEVCWLTRPQTTPGRILSITVARGVQAASESRVMLKQRVRWSRARRWSRVMHRVMHGGGAEQSDAGASIPWLAPPEPANVQSATDRN